MERALSGNWIAAARMADEPWTIEPAMIECEMFEYV